MTSLSELKMYFTGLRSFTHLHFLVRGEKSYVKGGTWYLQTQTSWWLTALHMVTMETHT